MLPLLLQVILWLSVMLLAYIFAGYPLLAWIRSCAAEKGRRGPYTRGVSIVIVAYNEAHSLPAKVRSLLASTAADQITEILIGSDGSTDQTATALSEIDDPRLKLISFEIRRGKPSVLNELVPVCQSDVVLLADARQLFDAQCIEQLLSHFEDPTVGAVSGELVLRERGDKSAAAAGIGFYWRYEKFIRRCESLGRGVPGATGACYVIRKSLFRPIPAQTILDDVVIPMQVVEQGYRCLFEPQAQVYDEPSKSTRQESIRKRRTIAGAAQLLRLSPRWLLPWKNPLWLEYVSHKLLRLVAPALMVLTLAANLCLLDYPAYRLLLVAQLGFYAAAAIGFGFQLWGKGSSLFGPPLMFVTLNMTTVAALWDAIRSNYRVTWQKT